MCRPHFFPPFFGVTNNVISYHQCNQFTACQGKLASEDGAGLLNTYYNVVSLRWIVICLGEFLLELLQKSCGLKIDFVVCNICRSWKLLPQSN